MKAKVRVEPLTSDAGEMISVDIPTCETFNTYFASVFPQEDVQNVSVPP